MFWAHLPTLWLPTFRVTPRLDRGVQGHKEWVERAALDSAITSRNDKCKSGDKITPPSPASLRLDRRVYSKWCLPQWAVLRTAEPPGAVLIFQGEWALRSSRRVTGVLGGKCRPAPYPSNASQGGTGLKVVTRWSIIRRTLAESALPGG